MTPVPASIAELPFNHPMRPYTRADVISVDPGQIGVYGIFRGSAAVYIGSGDIFARMIGHLTGDNTCVARQVPDQWTASITGGDPSEREAELIREYSPACNRRMKP
ncbi:MAG: hypothetical protein O3B04_04465 [Chloroflexi bacterium]|nr:hypothetical protein [Chloroflexota bacterium]MDA1297243.1 hypothetical protein [Chloroflexota bacterium]